MKKATFFAAALFLASVFSAGTAGAQDVKGKTFINAGIGIGTYGLYGSGGLPITFSAEHGVTKDISAGVYVGFVSRKYYWDYKYNYRAIGLRGSYHFNKILNVSDPKLDVYGGISIFHRGYTAKYTDSYYGYSGKTTAGTVTVGLHAAARYMFAEKVGAYAELGYGFSPLQIGATVKF